MSNELVPISPEGVEIANSYLTFGNIEGVCSHLGVARDKVSAILNSRPVKKYIDAIYLDTGFRNRNNIASLLDEMIKSKLEEAEESGIYTNKDLLDIIQVAQKIRMDEVKMDIEREKSSTNIGKQTNVQINDSTPFGSGKYGELMRALLTADA